MYKERFYREAQAAGKMHHAGIITVHDLGEDANGSPYLVMENVEGKTLDSVGGKNIDERLPLDQALDIGIQLAEALDYAHAQGVIHRDIKPSNIMLTTSGQAKIGDFGIAKLEGGHLTMTGQVLGTPSYMSPEQLTGATALDGRSDLFSLGVVMYQLLTGEKPFAAETVTAITYKVVHADPRPVRQLNPAISEDLEKVMARCLAKDPANRYANGRALASDLKAIRAGQPIAYGSV
jgi:eukaryotic-like serine/threonine-protein kinase